MKKLLLFLPILFVVTLVFPNNLSLFISAQPIQKEISISLFSGSNYSAAAYDDARAMVVVTISKQDAHHRVIIGKRTYRATALKQFPSAGNAFVDTFQLAGTVKNNEQLMVTYTITYNSNGSVITFENKDIIPKESATDTIIISI